VVGAPTCFNAEELEDRNIDDDGEDDDKRNCKA
jgi:hypothetical protein